MKAFFSIVGDDFKSSFKREFGEQIDKYTYGDLIERIEVVFFALFYPFRWLWRFFFFAVRSMVFNAAAVITLGAIFAPRATTELFPLMGSTPSKVWIIAISEWFVVNCVAVAACAVLGFIRIGPSTTPRLKAMAAMGGVPHSGRAK